MAVSLHTEDNLEYQFYPVKGSQIQFRVKAYNNAHIALTSDSRRDIWEVFIGGWRNSRSVILRGRTTPYLVEVPTPDILNPDEFRGFWIRWNGGDLTVGKEGEQDPFMSYSDPEPFDVAHFGVCTGEGSSGDWLIEAICIAGQGDRMPSSAQGQSRDDAGTGACGACWCDVTGGDLPPGAVLGGEDDEPLYVGRANHEGALIPGKVKPSHGVCYVAWGGQEHAKPEYQVLCGCEPIWVPVNDDNLPPNAFPAGETEDGEPLFVGRVNHESSLTPGKIQASHKCLYIPYAGQELSFKEYEVLTLN